MKTNLKYLIIIFSLILLFFIGYRYFQSTKVGNLGVIGNEPCRIWKPLYILNNSVSSEQDSKNAVIDFLNQNNVSFKPDNLKVQKLNTFEYEVSYYICGTDNILSFPTGDTFPFGYPEWKNNINPGPACSTIIYKVNRNQIMGNHINPC